ncbi:MAG: hypothetical protein FWG12_00455 [Holophagaceae bacterium]|nr:hypothetical protein [Holophagaceae bacterium]
MAQPAQYASVDRFRQMLRDSQRGMLVLIEDEINPLYPAFRKLLQEEGLAELRLRLWIIREERESELIEHLRSRFSWDVGPRWAFIDANERCLAQGTALPTDQALSDQLVQAGVESPVRRLRAYVRQYPENLDGKLALLSTLRNIADERTRGIVGEQQLYLGQDGRPRALGGSVRTRQMSEMVDAVGASEKPFQLLPEDDLKIWIRWADEFDRLMATGQWLESDFSFGFGADFLDRHSQIVRDTYRKRIGLVEDALRKWPGSNRIWGIWLHMFLVLGDRSAKAFVDSLVPMPDSAIGTWPPHEAKMVLIQEARRTGYWRDVRDILWDSWLQFCQSMSEVRRGVSPGGRNPWDGGRIVPRMLEAQWQQLFDPLIESLIMTGDISSADTVLSQLKELGGGDEISNLAVAIAERCQMPRVAERWKNLF